MVFEGLTDIKVDRISASKITPFFSHVRKNRYWKKKQKVWKRQGNKPADANFPLRHCPRKNMRKKTRKKKQGRYKVQARDCKEYFSLIKIRTRFAVYLAKFLRNSPSQTDLFVVFLLRAEHQCAKKT